MSERPQTAAIRASVDGRGVASITFDKPDKSNAFDAGMRDEVVRLLASFAEDPTVRVVILRGRGKHFSSGSDVSAFGDQSSDQRVEIFLRLDAFPKPTIALVQGACLGAALALVACCDVVIAAPDAFFSIPEVRLGIAPLGLAPIFLRALGQSAFRHYGLSGDRFDGAEALRLGLVHRLCEPGAFDAAAAALADSFLRGGRQAVAAIKQTARRLGSPADFAQSIRDLAQQERALMQTPEAREGIASARDKRPPVWYPKP